MEDIRKEVEFFLQKMTFPAIVSVQEHEEGIARVAVQTEDARFLIGAGGEMIGCLDALIKKVIQKKIPTAPRFFIDINDYRQKKVVLLQEDARNYAKLVMLYRKEKVLDPMPAYERRIIHSALSEYSDIRTESVGEEPERHIVIKPNQI
jgi:spoIIIJ-associated protein